MSPRRSLWMLSVLSLAALALTALLASRPAGLAAAPAAPAAPATVATTGNGFGATWHLQSLTMPHLGDAYADPVHGRLYQVGPQRITAWDSHTAAQLGFATYSGTYGPPALVFDDDYAHLYVSSAGARQATIAIHDTPALAKTGQFTFTCADDDQTCFPATLAAGPNGRVYLLPYLSDRLEVVDSHTGATLHTLSDPGLPNGDRGTLMAHGDRLYIANYFDAAEDATGLAVFDISAVVPVRVAFHPIGPANVYLSPDGQFLAIQRATVQQYRAEPFEMLWEAPGDIWLTVAGHYANNDLLIYRDRTDQPTVVSALDAETGALRHSLQRARRPDRASFRQALPLDDGRLAVLFPTTIDLMRPVDYGFITPLVMNNACPGGPIIDRFRDPTSGWPIISDGPITTRYFEDSYRITLRDAGLWTAVTRGDYWYKADLAIAMGHTLGDPLEPAGVTGFLYGLNDDWSDFYTVEISLYRHRYAHYHYHDGQWELLHEGSGIGGVTDAVLVGLDRRAATGEVILRVSTGELYAIEEVPGRVGIIAGSFVPNVEARYTHYEFHGQNCTPNGSRAAQLQFAPAHVTRSHPVARD